MLRLVLVAVLGLFLVAGCAPAATPASPTANPGATPPGPAAGEVDVAIQGFAFSPKELKVAPGATVRWTNKDSAAHTATAKNPAFDSGSLSQGQNYSYKFAQAGTYEYACTFHANMTATVIVQ